MLIKYGLRDNTIDVTSICNEKLKIDKYIVIPISDIARSKYFSDPFFGKIKSVFIIYEDNTVVEYDCSKPVYIDTQLNKVVDTVPYSILSIDERLALIHRNLILKYGTFLDELPEQKMAIRYLKGSEKILEIGGNIGRNSLIISHILGKNSSNLVVLESDTGISNQLNENKELNSMQFHIENSALSKRNLIQRGWDTIVSDTLLPGYKPVKTIAFDQLVSKYSIQFDTLVLDCEGAFYYILQDMPEVLNNVTLILMENDYHDITHKEYVDKILKENNFRVDYSQDGGWGPCKNKFFEAWVKNAN